MRQKSRRRRCRRRNFKEVRSSGEELYSDGRDGAAMTSLGNAIQRSAAGTGKGRAVAKCGTLLRVRNDENVVDAERGVCFRRRSNTGTWVRSRWTIGAFIDWASHFSDL